jgi:hypothetical protein
LGYPYLIGGVINFHRHVDQLYKAAQPRNCLGTSVPSPYLVSKIRLNCINRFFTSDRNAKKLDISF